MTRNRPCPVRAITLCAGIAFLAVTGPDVARSAGKPAGLSLSNGDFQTNADGDGVPDGWPALKGGVSYPADGTNRFMRLAATGPYDMVIAYRQVRIPNGVPGDSTIEPEAGAPSVASATASPQIQGRLVPDTFCRPDPLNARNHPAIIADAIVSGRKAAHRESTAVRAGGSRASAQGTP